MDALIIVDPQIDFCPGGALGVPEGDAIIPAANRLLGRFPVTVVTQDWHPAGHLSFASSHPGKEPFSTVRMPYGEQILWPDHCVQGSDGASLHPDLHIDGVDLIIRKGGHREIDSYSTFYENDHATPTGLAGFLKERGVTRIVLAGLAFDFCVLWSARDGRKLGFEVVVVPEASRAIDLEGSASAAENEIRELGCEFKSLEELLRPA